MIYWYGIVGTPTYSSWSDVPWNDRPPEWIEMLSGPPEKESRYGAFIVQTGGTWLWETYPDPAFNITMLDGKLQEFRYNETYVDVPPSATPLLASKEWVLAEIAAAIAALPTS